MGHPLLTASPLGNGWACVVATIRLGTVYHQSKRPLLVVTKGGGDTACWSLWRGEAASSPLQLLLTVTIDPVGHCCPRKRGQRRRKTANCQSQGWLPILFAELSPLLYEYSCFVCVQIIASCVCVCKLMNIGTVMKLLAQL